MDSFELNKIAGAILFSLLILLLVGNLASVLYDPSPANPQAYIVEGLETAAADSSAAAVEEGPSLAMLLAIADIAAGEKSARKCVACHTFDESGANKVGPNLWNIVAQPVAAKSGFNYSSAMAELGGDWDYDRMDAFLQAPRKYVPGTKMSFAGVRKEQERANLIAYMRSLSASPPPLPQAAEPEASEDGMESEAQPVQ